MKDINNEANLNETQEYDNDYPITTSEDDPDYGTEMSYNVEDILPAHLMPKPGAIAHIQMSDDSANEREYLLLMVLCDENGEHYKDFEFVTGREEAYAAFKQRIEYIDLFESMIIVEGEDGIKNRPSAYRFMKYCLERCFVIDPGFDIDDYAEGDDEIE